MTNQEKKKRRRSSSREEKVSRKSNAGIESSLRERRVGISVLKPTEAEKIQTIIYSTGKENGYSDDLRSWFKLIYQVTFGEENGPRMGFFISFFGIKETIDLIETKLRI